MTDAAQKPNTFFIDDREVDIRPGETIFRAARRLDINLPHLCYTPKPGYRPDGNCRVCMVEVEGERVLAASCIRSPTPGMKVKTQTERASAARRMVAELLMTDQPDQAHAHDPDSELWKIAKRQKIEPGRFPKREPIKVPAPDRSHVAMAVNLDACIQCNLCVRACREVQVNDVIGMAGRGHLEQIVFDFNDPMGASTCVACGECVQACPTGALMPSTMVDENNVYKGKPDREVDSVCPYCGVGCQLTYQIKDDKIVAVAGRDGPANQNRLCVKGRFGFDYVHNKQRLLKPMIRKDGVPKVPHEFIDPSNPWTHFREATWDEALDRAAGGLKKIRDRDGPRALAGFGSAKGSNEEAYLFQKLVRTGFGSNNVDIYRGLVLESLGLARAAGVHVWVVEGGTRGPFAESSRLPGDTRDIVAAQWGVAAAGAVAYQNVEAQHRGATKRLLVVGAEIGRPGEAAGLVAGRPILRSRYEAIADRRLGLALGERIELGRDTFTIVGLTENVVASGGDPVVFVTLRDAQKLQFDLTPAAARREAARTPGVVGSTNTVNAILVRLLPGVDMAHFAQTVERWKQLSALTQEQQENVLAGSVIERARRQIGLFTTLLLLVSTVIIGLIIYTMTIDKKKSIATLKLIGAPDSRIVGLIVQQAIALGVISFVVGTVLINSAQGYFPRRVVLEPADAAALFVIVLAVCLLASSLGVRTALKIDPASALAG